MKVVALSKLVCLVAVLGIATGGAAYAQTFQTVFVFNETNGAVPTDVLVQGTDGNIYGTTQYGGAADSGTVFRLTSAGVLTTIHSFCSRGLCADGSLPTAGLVQGSDGSLYGTTFSGGTTGAGTVFKITSSGSFTTLYTFCSLATCADGANPHAALVQGTDGNFYGVTLSGGGLQSAGTVFKITPAGAVTTLYDFCSRTNCADGLSPDGWLTQGADGNFYGTTAQGGGPSQGGTVFRLTPSGTLTTLYNFCSLNSCADGEYPYAGLAKGSDGNFYGTTSGSAPNTMGTIFRITPSGSLTTLYSFCGLANCADGEYPFAGVVQGTDGNFYGTTEAGGIINGISCSFGCGTYFRITPSGALTTFYSFCSSQNCPDGAQPYAGVVQLSNGNFYGTTSYGGTCSTRVEGCGTVFSWSPNVTLPPTLNPTSLNFPSQAVDTTSAARSVGITNVNTGSATLDFNGITLSGSADFSISSTTCGATLLPGRVCKVSITYAPTIIGTESATLNIADNAPGSPQTVPISGTSVAQATVTPTSLSFPKTKVGTTSGAKNVTLRNNLPTTLSAINYKATSPFAVSTSTCGTTLASRASCTVSVTFTPKVTGTSTGTLTITDSANNSPQTTSLTGTGN